MKNKVLLLIPLLFLGKLLSPLPAVATHLRGGEIVYRTDEANPLKVYVEITLYLNTHSAIMETSPRLNMGDGTEKTTRHLPERDGTLVGQTIKRVWQTEHTYASPGAYRISFTGINRNEGVVNITNSVQQTLFIYSNLTLAPQAGGHSSPRLLAPPTLRAIANQPFQHNLTAYDPDGDSLGYALVIPLAAIFPTPQPQPAPVTTVPVEGYRFADDFSLTPHTGEIIWPTAGKIGGETVTGEFTFAVQISKFRQGQVVSQVVRDFQIMVVAASFRPELTLIRNPAEVGIANGNTIEASVHQPLDLRFLANKGSADSVHLFVFRELLLDTEHATAEVTRATGATAGRFRLIPQASLKRSLPYLLIIRTQHYYPDHPQFPVQHDLTLLLTFTDGTLTATPHLPLPLPVRMYPNPAHEYFVVELPDGLERHLVLYSADGKEVFRQALTATSSLIVRPQHLKAGIYRYALTFPGSSAQAQFGKLMMQ